MGRLLPGPKDSVMQESISGRMLIELGIVDPDLMPTIMSLHADLAPFMALLDMRGYKTSGVNYGTNFLLDNGRFRTVSSNHVQFKIEASDWRIERFRPNANGVTYEDMANPTKPGLGKLPFYIYLDSNFAGGSEVILLADGRTQLFIVDKTGGEEVSGGVFRYKVKVDGNNIDEYADPKLLADGAECQVATSKYRQDFSTGGNEKHFFGGFGDAFLTLQRFKYSYSGTAEAMDRNKKVSGRWVSANAEYKNMSFLSDAEDRMLKMAAKYTDFQLLEGKTTVDYTDKKVKLTDDEHQEVLSGAGVLYGGDGALEFPQNNGWTKSFIDAFLKDADSYIRPNESGNRDLFMLMHPTSYLSFQAAMRDFGITSDANIIGQGDDKMINNTYRGYSLAGINLIAVRSTALSQRPGMTMKDGTRSNEWDTICLPLGLSSTGERGIELIQLRPNVRGTVAGINKGGQISNDIDGTTEHLLVQVGVISMIQPIRIYRPWDEN